MDYGKEIKKIREKIKISQQVLATTAKIDRTHVNNIENGRRNVSEALFVKIIESMGYTLSKKIVKKIVV